MIKHTRLFFIAIVLVYWVGSSLTLAQTEPQETAPPTETSETIAESGTWFSVSSSLHYVIPSLDVHIGVEDALGEGIDLRTTLSGFWTSSTGINTGFFAIGVNGLIESDNNNPNVKNYMGFGPRLLIGFNNYYTYDGYEFYDVTSNTFFAVGGFWGTEYNAQGAIRPFYEINGSLPIIFDGQIMPVFVPVLSLTAGFNFYF